MIATKTKAFQPLWEYHSNSIIIRVHAVELLGIQLGSYKFCNLCQLFSHLSGLKRGFARLGDSVDESLLRSPVMS